MVSSSGVLILHNIPRTADDACDGICAEADAGVLDQVAAVERALESLGVPSRRAGVRDLSDLPRELSTATEPIVFNLVESLRGGPRDFTLVPAVCAAFGKVCTGGDTLCLANCFDKWLTKAALQAAEIATPEAVIVWPSYVALPAMPEAPLIVKPLLAEASEGIDADSVFEASGPAVLVAVRRVHEQFGCPALVERFIGGRELNVSVLQRGATVEVLPLAEIEFVGFTADMPRVVGYRAKWLPDTFEFRNTPRRIPADLPVTVAEQVRHLARQAWDALGCQDYARVDFRLDAGLRPYVLEVNSNPDISPDAGFVAALKAAGISSPQFVEAMTQNARARGAAVRACDGALPAAAARPGGAVIRRTLPEDRQPILDIAVETQAFRPEEVAVACEVLDGALRDGPDGDYQSYTALVNGRPVGWACFGPTPCTQGTFDLYWIMVAPQAQGTGAGRALISHAERLIAERGGRLVIVEAAGGPAGNRARGFYIKVGYEEAARVRDFYAPGDDKVIYVKQVGPSCPSAGA